VGTKVNNYSRDAAVEGAMIATSVTIGYDVPWRQIHALLKMAADRCSEIRQNPEPRVLQQKQQTALCASSSGWASAWLGRGSPSSCSYWWRPSSGEAWVAECFHLLPDGSWYNDGGPQAKGCVWPM